MNNRPDEEDLREMRRKNAQYSRAYRRYQLNRGLDPRDPAYDERLEAPEEPDFV